jgi:zinc transporter ZupT
VSPNIGSQWELKEFNQSAIMNSFSGANTTALVLSLISGLSTGLGGIIIILFDTPSPTAIGYLLSLSSGVMLYVSFFDLIPETIEKIGIAYCGLWV